MEQLLKVKDNESLARDPVTGVILNFDTAERTDVMKRRLLAIRSRMEIEKQNNEINNIKNELGEIKELLLSLIQSKT